MLKFNFLSMRIIFQCIKPAFLYAGLNKKLTLRIQVQQRIQSNEETKADYDFTKENRNLKNSLMSYKREMSS